MHTLVITNQKYGAARLRSARCWRGGWAKRNRRRAPPLLYSVKAFKGSSLLDYTGWAGRMLISAALAVAEPFVRFTLTTLATLGMFVTISFGLLMGAKGFPTGFMLAMSVGCFLLLGAYYAVMRSFGHNSDERELR